MTPATSWAAIAVVTGLVVIALAFLCEIADILACRYGHRLQARWNRSRLSCRRCHELIQDVRPASHRSHLL